MTFDLDTALLLCQLNESAYVFCETGTCSLPDGFTPAHPITVLGMPSKILAGDPMTSWGFFTKKGNQQYVVFRGTQDKEKQHVYLQEWCADLWALPMVKMYPGRVHRGFWTAYQDLFECLDKSGVEKDAIITGHSLGAALATLCAVDFGGDHQPLDLTTFEGPRVGDADFSKGLSGTVRIINEMDIVPRIPAYFGFTNGQAQQEVLVHGNFDLVDLHVAHNLESVRSGLEKLKPPPSIL